MKAMRIIGVVAALAAGAAFVSCGPKPAADQLGRGAVAPGVPDACRDVTMYEAAVARDSNELAVLRTDVATREAELVELQRLRSRIVTGRIADDELAAWGRDTTRVEETPAEAVDTSAADVTAAPVDSMAATTVSDSGAVTTGLPPEATETAAPAAGETAIVPAEGSDTGTAAEAPVTGEQAPSEVTESSASPAGEQAPVEGTENQEAPAVPAEDGENTTVR